MLWNVYSLMILLSSATFLLFSNFPLACLYGSSLYFHALAIPILTVKKIFVGSIYFTCWIKEDISAFYWLCNVHLLRQF